MSTIEGPILNVGVVGTGLMGAPMVTSLLAAGHAVRVYNRTAEKTERLVAAGALPAETPAQTAAGSHIVITMLTDPDAVNAVTFGPDGILDALPFEGVHTDMSTVTPQSAASLAAAYASAGKRFVQAPVLGNKKHIADGKLLIFAGGLDDDIDACEAAWRAFSTEVRRFPDAAQASTAKLASNMLIGQMILALGQTLVYARAGGIDPSTMLDIIMASNLASPMYANKGKSLIERNFTPNFFVRHMLKDLNLASQSGSEASVPQPMNATARELFVAAVAKGFGDEDYSAVVKVLEDMAGLEIAG